MTKNKNDFREDGRQVPVVREGVLGGVFPGGVQEVCPGVTGGLRAGCEGAGLPGLRSRQKEEKGRRPKGHDLGVFKGQKGRELGEPAAMASRGPTCVSPGRRRWRLDAGPSQAWLLSRRCPEQVGSQEVVFRLWIQPPWPTGLLRNLWGKSAAQGLGVCPPQYLRLSSTLSVWASFVTELAGSLLV